MSGHFSDTLIEAIREVLDQGEQVILFQNRRGYSPIIECKTCGNSPQCPHCDVSLTYHQYKNQLRCHYCGYHMAMPLTCPACHSVELDSKGLGTEQVVKELKSCFLILLLVEWIKTLHVGNLAMKKSLLPLNKKKLIS